jgi:ubiquinone biosynthesis UbiH/UbiF/VisC/COQ6 family hydroxylase
MFSRILSNVYTKPNCGGGSPRQQNCIPIRMSLRTLLPLSRGQLTKTTNRLTSSHISKVSRPFASLSVSNSDDDKKVHDVPTYDVLVVGGGIVGSALACLLKTNPLFKGKNVALIETENPPPAGPVGEDTPDLRVYTITPSSQTLFEKMKVWNKIPETHRAAFKDMQVWDAMGDGFIRFDAEKAGHKILGHVVESKVLVRALHDRMNELTKSKSDSAPLKLYCPAKVKHFHRPNTVNGLSEIGLDDGTRMRTTLVVAADGGNSIIRTLSALGTWGWEYNQKAVVATVKTDSPNHTAWQRFFPTGPIALLPMRDGYSSIVWSCTDEMATELTSLSPEAFTAKLNDALFSPPKTPVPPEFPGLPILTDLVKGVNHAANTIMSAAALSDPFVAPPKPIQSVGKRFAFPLKMKHATSYVKPGVALIGDSAHTVHPLAGQGLNLGLADVSSLAQLLEDGILSGENFSSEYFLQEYEQDRKASNITMAVAVDGFKRLFGPTPDAVGVARNVGMGTLNAVEPLKNQIMRYAMGL